MKIENDVYAVDWKPIPVKGNIGLLNGYPFDSAKFNDKIGLPLIRIRNILKGFSDTFYNGEYSEEYLIEEGDILVGMDGDFNIKRWSGGKALLNQRILKLYEEEDSQIDLKYFFYLAQPFLLKVHERTSGTTVKHLSTKDFLNAFFKLPPLPEQQKIADILSTVDEKIELIDQQIAETEALKKGLMQRLLTKGIGHSEFKDSPLGKIPSKWNISSLENHSFFITKGSTPTTYGFNWEDSGVLFLRSECVSPSGFSLNGAMYISEEANNVMERSKIISGDILMTITGNVGRVCIFPSDYEVGNINQHIARIRITDTKLNPQFIFHFLSQDSLINNHYKITTGQAYPQLSLKQVREMKVPIPSREEQDIIAEILNSVDEKIILQNKKKEEFKDLKKGLMQQLLTGKIRVNTLVEA